MTDRLALALCLGFGMYAQAYALPVNNSGNPGGATTVASPVGTAAYEILDRIEQLQGEIQQLRGVVEEQAQTIADLQRKQNNMYADLDGRVQALTPPAPPPPSAPPAAGGTSAAPVAVESAAPVSGAGQPSTTTQPAAVAANQAAPAAASVTAPVASGNEKEGYQSAYDSLRNGHNEQAIKLFESLLNAYPNGELVDSVQYGLAEAYRLNRETDKAKAAYNKLVSKYPNSSKVPDALLKLGYIEYDMQHLDKSREYLNRVVAGYPDSTPGHLAAKKLLQMNQ